MVNSWQALEDLAVEILKEDHPIKPKGSGNGKKEEDVISNTTITQCKYTQSKNVSILDKDLQRLLDACNLQDKFPLFLTSNDKGPILSIPINDDTEKIIKSLIELLLILKGSEKLEEDIRLIRTMGHYDVLSLKRDRVNILIYNVRNKLESIASKLTRMLIARYDDLTMCDLFEGEKDGVK